MMRSMFSAISGLRNHQTLMDVIGNNLANVNTVGYKSSRVNFQDILNQTLRVGSPSTTLRGGVNPVQIGMGSTLAGVDTIQTQGTLQSTGKFTDLAIQGDGYFVMSDGTNRYYTRDGSFDVSQEGNLIDPDSGLKLYGWTTLDVNGAIDTTKPLAALNIPTSQGMISQATATTTFQGNLDTRATTPYTLDATVYDSQGGTHQITFTFTKTAANTWSWAATTLDAAVTLGGTTSGAMTFDPTTGALLAPNPNPPLTNPVTAPTANPALSLTFSTGPAAQTVTLSLGAMTQLTGNGEVTSSSQGAAPGTLSSFTIGQSGDVYGVYSNGITKLLGRVATATFGNPAGLLKKGGNLCQTSPDSGDPVLGSPETGKRGAISSGFLEGSNVDLAQEFTNMIMAERGFQANSRVISTSDNILQELVNLKR